MKEKWGFGAKVWFVLMILVQWLMFIVYVMDRTTRINRAYQQSAINYGFIGLIGTILYIWLAFRRSRSVFIMLMILAAVSSFSSMITGGINSAILCLVCTLVTYTVVHDHVE